MSGRRSRDKGQRGQRRWAKWLQRWWPEARSSGDQAGGGDRCADIEGTPFHFEAKEQKKPSVWAAVSQAEHGAARTGRPAIALVHKSATPTRPPEQLVAMRPEVFAGLLDAAAEEAVRQRSD